MNRFDELAADWDDDPAKVARAAAAAAVLRDRIPLAGSGWRALELGSGTGLLSRALAADPNIRLQRVRVGGLALPGLVLPELVAPTRRAP